jgi:hypothetical protein
MLKEYVKQEFFDLPEKHWSNSMVIGFIIKAISLDTNVYESIVDISKADLYQHMAEFDDIEIEREQKEIQKAFLSNAKDEIKTIIEDIQYVFDQEETESQLRRDFERVEGAAINRSRGI